MPITSEFLKDSRHSNSSVQRIEVRRTRTEYCFNHIFLVSRNQDDATVSTEVAGKKLKPLEWTQRRLVLDDSDFIKFDVTYNCPGVQDMARCASEQEHIKDIQKPSLYCYCMQWV